MINLNVLHIALLEITAVSIDEKLSPVVFPVLGGALLIYQLLQRLDNGIVGWEEEEWNWKPFLRRIDHHPVLHTLILVIAPNLHKHAHYLTICWTLNEFWTKREGRGKGGSLGPLSADIWYVNDVINVNLFYKHNHFVLMVQFLHKDGIHAWCWMTYLLS